MRRTRLVLAGLALAGCAGDDGAVCEPGFGAAAVLIETAADVELAADGALVLATATDPQSQVTTLYARAHGLDGAPRGPAAPLASDAGRYGAGAVRIDGGWAILWAEDEVLWLAELSDAGELAEPVAWHEQRGSVYVHALARVADGYAATWSVDDRLVVAIGSGAAAAQVFQLGRGEAPAIASAGGELGLAWADADRTVWFATVPVGGNELVDPVEVGPLADYLPPSVCADGDGYLVAHTVRPEGTVGDVHVTRFAGGAASASLLVSDGTGTSWAPAIACADGAIAVAWHHALDGTVPGTDLGVSQIEFATVAPDLVSASAPLPVEPSTDAQHMLPRLAPDGAGGYHVTWTEFGPAGYRTKLATIGSCAL